MDAHKQLLYPWRNKWYDAGDKRFHPDNIIFDARNSNILGIIEKSTGKIVWRVGPNFNESEATKKLGWIIGQHHLHMIPKGLPGEGDLLVFDNGGEGGYGTPNPASLTGVNNAHRDYSRVLQFNPVTLEITWQYTPLEAGNLLLLTLLSSIAHTSALHSDFRTETLLLRKVQMDIFLRSHLTMK